MKKLVLISLIIFLGFALKTEAQVYSPQLVGHNGTRNIYYPYGYYQGNVSNGIANGIGTFYFKDGSFYHGRFSNGWWHGKGVIVSPLYGYLTGCWSNGGYIGECPSENRYDDQDEVENIISDVQFERPDDSRYIAVSPEGYKIKRIDSDTQMGKKLLGRYSGK